MKPAAFTSEELKRIYDNLDDFTRPLFMMAVWTGFREGDICTLKWNEVDLVHRWNGDLDGILGMTGVAS